MHTCALIIGTDVDAILRRWWRPVPDPITGGFFTRADRTLPDVDGWAIGERFTGQLLPRAEAPSAKVYGRAPSALDVALSSMLAARSNEVMTPTSPGPGVDQVRVGECDIEASAGNFALVLARTWWLRAPTDLEMAELELGMVRLGAYAPGSPLGDPEVQADLRGTHARLQSTWKATVLDRLRALRPDELLTVVDLHY